jgi:hypothetical protein
MPLTPADVGLIQSLSRQEVERTLAGMRHFIKRSMWLGKNNRYSTDTIEKIKNDCAQGNRINERQLAQYIAASCLLHCSDGWSYLGRAISALLGGDPHRTRHLAYYAELRAAMSLLASCGIGIFKNKHFAIDRRRSVKRLSTKDPTHQFAWECLQVWGGQPHSGAMFAQVIKPYGRTLDDWFEPVGGGAVVAPQAQEWFQQWGMDLKVFADDREARNESSYRPDGLPSAWSVTASRVLGFARELWMALEPSGNSHFDTIDRHILRLSIERLFIGRTNKRPGDDPRAFDQFVERIVEHQALGPAIQAELGRFLRRQVMPADLEILSYSQKSPEARINSDVGIVSRAALLLRVSSGSCAALLRNADLTSDSMSFWWSQLGQDRGLWEGAYEATDLLDLWADIKTWLEDIESFEQNSSATPPSFFKVGSDLRDALRGLGSCERVGIWSTMA